MTGTLAGKTILMSGGSRGIGLAILVAAAREGANAVLLAKTDTPDPRLPGTVHTAVEEISVAGKDTGARAVPVVGDVRVEEDVARAVQTAVDTFGGIDIVVNNASALNMAGTLDLPMKRYDLMQQINARGTFLLTRTALPHLFEAADPQILTLSPPINQAPHWLAKFPAYTITKYGMTVLTLGWAAEFADRGVRANCLWPQTTIATAAVKNILGDDARARQPEIMADAAVLLLADPKRPTGQTVLDSEVLGAAGITELAKYGGGDDPEPDFYVDL